MHRASTRAERDAERPCERVRRGDTEPHAAEEAGSWSSINDGDIRERATCRAERRGDCTKEVSALRRHHARRTSAGSAERHGRCSSGGIEHEHARVTGRRLPLPLLRQA